MASRCVAVAPALATATVAAALAPAALTAAIAAAALTAASLTTTDAAGQRLAAGISPDAHQWHLAAQPERVVHQPLRPDGAAAQHP